MPRLRNVQTGSVVNVDDVTAARLGGGWEPVDKPKKSPRRRKADADDDGDDK